METAPTTAGDATVCALQAAGAAFESRRIRLGHLAAFTYGLKHVDTQMVIDAQDWLLGVAHDHEPAELLRVIIALREAIYPDELDALSVRLRRGQRPWTAKTSRSEAAVQAATAARAWTDRINGTTAAAQNPARNSAPACPAPVLFAWEMPTPADAADPTTTGLPGHLAGFGAVGPQLLG